MADIPFVATPPSPTSQKKQPSLLTWAGMAIIFMSIAGISAYLTMSLFSKTLPQIAERTPTTIEINRLIDPCLLYFKVCDTSYKGLTSQDSLSTMLALAESPIMLRPPVDFVQKDDQVIQLPAPTVLTIIASDEDINPFLLATLSEIQYGTFFQKTVNVNNTIQHAGIVKTAFMGQHLNMAQQVKGEITAQGLTATTLPPPVNTYTSQKFGVKIQMHHGTAADVVLLKYLEQNAASSSEFTHMVTDFIPTYQLIASLNPDTTEKNLKPEFLPTPVVQPEDIEAQKQIPQTTGSASSSAQENQ